MFLFAAHRRNEWVLFLSVGSGVAYKWRKLVRGSTHLTRLECTKNVSVAYQQSIAVSGVDNRMYTMAMLWSEDLKRLRERTIEKDGVLSSGPHSTMITDSLVKHPAALTSHSTTQQLESTGEEEHDKNKAHFRGWLSVSLSSSSTINTMVDCFCP